MELQLNLDFDDAAPVAKKVRLSRDQGKGTNCCKVQSEVLHSFSEFCRSSLHLCRKKSISNRFYETHNEIF